MNVKIHLKNQQRLDEAISKLNDLELNGAYEVSIKRLPQTRTGQQRKAIEVYCRELAKAWRGAGLSVEFVLSKTLDTEWTQELVKEAIFKKATDRQFNKKSTTQLEPQEVTKVYDIVNRFAGQFGIHVPFPDKNAD